MHKPVTSTSSCRQSGSECMRMCALVELHVCVVAAMVSCLIDVPGTCIVHRALILIRIANTIINNCNRTCMCSYL